MKPVPGTGVVCRTTSVLDVAARAVARVDALGDRSTTISYDANRTVATIDALGVTVHHCHP